MFAKFVETAVEALFGMKFSKVLGLKNFTWSTRDFEVSLYTPSEKVCKGVPFTQTISNKLCCAGGNSEDAKDTTERRGLYLYHFSG